MKNNKQIIKSPGGIPFDGITLVIEGLSQQEYWQTVEEQIAPGIYGVRQKFRLKEFFKSLFGGAKK